MALVLAYDMSTRTAAGLMKNLAPTGYIYDGTINGTYTSAPPLIRAKKTPCMDFIPANNNYISLANPLTSLTEFTIVLWTNLDALNGMWYSRASAAGSYIYPSSSGDISFYMAGGGYNTSGKQKITTGRTFMIAATRSATESRIHVDGVMRTKATLAAFPADANAFIGQYWDASLRFDGRIDNYLIFNTALTPEQIWSIYRSANPRMPMGVWGP